MKELVIWAHSECRSNAALYAEVKRLAEARGIRVTMCLWDVMPMAESRKVHGLEWIRVGDDMGKGRGILAAHGGKDAVHVFCVYQNSAVWRRLILEAKRGGARVVVSAEAPCEMCVGAKAILKRMYYRRVLPLKVGKVARTADLFLNASGAVGVDRLARLGWPREKIVPFGYASAPAGELGVRSVGVRDCGGEEVGETLKVLHAGIETPYRDVATLRRAVELLKDKGIAVELVCTGGKVSDEEMSRLYNWADVFVACGLCEPWGMRVNDAVHAGLPAVVSDGMGASWLVEQFGCGGVYPAGDASALAKTLERFAADVEFRDRLVSGVAAAHEAWMPEARAKVWLEEVLGA